MKGTLDMDSHKMTNVYMDYLSGTDATKKMHHSHVQPSHQKNQFDYLMKNTLEWTDLISGGNSFNVTKIADLSKSQGNFHSYNHKVIIQQS